MLIFAVPNRNSPKANVKKHLLVIWVITDFPTDGNCATPYSLKTKERFFLALLVGGGQQWVTNSLDLT